MSQGVTDEQKRCIVSWFRNWSAEQRAAFVFKVEQRITQRSDVDQLLSALTLEESNSIFDYQVKLFRRWATNWDLADLLDLLTTLQE